MKTTQTSNLFQAAREVLENNTEYLDDKTLFTKPSNELYPFQWNWDAGFIAYGYAHFDPDRAVVELRTLFSGQWANGMLPHIIFHKEAEGYFPYDGIWEAAETNPNAPQDIRTSAMTQPPVHALAVWHIYKRLREANRPNDARSFLEEFYPKLLNLHRWFLTARDPEQWGLVTIFHPWESGFDNSPRWDEPLSRLSFTPDDLPSYQRVDTSHVPESARPTNERYDQFMYLLFSQKKHGYEDEKIYKHHPFRVKDIVASSILYLANTRLRLIAEELNEDTAEIDEWMRRFEKHLFEQTWSDDNNLFYDLDLATGEHIRVKTVASLLPLMTGLLSEREIDELMTNVDAANFCGEDSCTVTLVPSTGRGEAEFDEDRYWRGPVWFNINWLLWKGFLESGLLERAEEMRRDLLDLVSRVGFCEYYDPIDDEGLGADSFSWTAALTIDLLSHEPENK